MNKNQDSILICDRCGHNCEHFSIQDQQVVLLWKGNRFENIPGTGIEFLCDKCTESFFQFMNGKALTL